MEAARRKPETNSPHVCMNRFALGTLCTLALGLVLSACSSSNVGGDTDGLHGAVTVSFNKNNRDVGSTEASPDNLTILPPATTLGSLPEKPTRPGYRFVEWNTEAEGSGETFTEDTPIQGKVHLMVYARWEPLPRLSVEVAPGTIVFTPMTNEDFVVFSVRVSGFKNEADASAVKLDLSLRTGNEPTWFLWQPKDSRFSEGTKTFAFNFSYLSKNRNFDEAPATLSLNLGDIPAGYVYSDGTQTLRVSAANGKDKTRPIPVHQGNLETFNTYANTDGLALHYQLIENVTLPKKPNNWVAIGTYVDWDSRSPFTGSFDGGGHSISGLNIDNSKNYQGLFGYIRGEEAVIKNLGLKDGSVKGGGGIGGVVGENEGGTVQDCYYVAGSVSGSGSAVGGVVGSTYGNSTVQNCYVTGDVEGLGNVGGVVGYNTGEVQNCYATGIISGNSSGSSVGGVVGSNSGGKIQNCYATGEVSSRGNSVGGVSGSNSGEIQNCYATGSVSGNNNVGGVSGSNSGEIQNCYATGDVEGRSYVGGVVGRNSLSKTVQNCVALNPSVTLTFTGDTIGRVVGQNNTGGILTNNRARSGMRQINHDETTIPPSGDSDSKEGLDVSAKEYSDSPFWEGLCSVNVTTGENICWNFEKVWEWKKDSLLPILREVGGEQNPDVRSLPL